MTVDISLILMWLLTLFHLLCVIYYFIKIAETKKAIKEALQIIRGLKGNKYDN
jgi:hypothetical protein